MNVSEMQEDLVAIKNDLIGRKAVYEREKTEAEKAMNELKEILSSIKEDDLQFLAAHGFDAFFLQSVDVEQLGKDAETLATLKENIGNLCEALYDSIKGEI